MDFECLWPILVSTNLIYTWHTYMHACIHTHTHTYIHAHTYIHTHTYIHMYVCTHFQMIIFCYNLFL